MAQFKGSLVIPSLTAAPGSPTGGQLYYNSVDGNTYVYDAVGATWVDVTAAAAGGSKTFRTVHTWAIKGTVAVETTPPFFFSKAAGQTTNIVKARYKITSGTAVGFKIQKSGADWTGYGTTAVPLVATTGASTTTQTNALIDDDELDLVILSATGPPVDLTVTVVLEHTV